MQENTPEEEITSRWQRCRALLQQYLPQAEGIFLFSRLNIYYFSGTFANGVLWLPMDGEPLLFCRKGVERARLESPIRDIRAFRFYGDIATTFAELSVALPSCAAGEMNGLPWSLANSLVKHLPGVRFVAGDTLIGMTRAQKSPWELEIQRTAGRRHDRCLTRLLPPLLHEGITELEISHRISDLFYSQGNHGILRMGNFGEEAFLGHIAIGDSANYPSVFNGPVGLRGVHPAVPFMGSDQVAWQPGQPLTIDNGFCLAGYQTDKTQLYWLGAEHTIPDPVKRAHAFCLEMQAWLVEQLRPGAIPSSLWQQCLERAAKSPWQEGFMGLGRNKVEFVGHGIGLVIDEYPVLAKGFDLPLEEGMVLAIEPKIGIPGIGMVGTENTFEVTATGGQSLTGSHYDIITI